MGDSLSHLDDLLPSIIFYHSLHVGFFSYYQILLNKYKEGLRFCKR